MKQTIKLLLATIGLINHQIAFAQNIGIGNTNPQEKLHVSGGILSDSVKIGTGNSLLRTSALGPLTMSINADSYSGFHNAMTPGWQSFTALSNCMLEQVRIGYWTVATIGELRIYSGEGSGGTMLISVPMGDASPGYNNSPVLNVYLQEGQKYTIWVANRSGWLWDFSSYPGGRSDIDANYDKQFRVFTRSITKLFDVMGSGSGQLSLDQAGSSINVNGKLSAGTLRISDGAGAGKVLISDASGNAAWQTSTTYNWGLDGNSVVTEPRLGTVSHHPLRIITKNIEVARFHTSGGLSIGTSAVGEKLFVDGNIMLTPSNSLYLGGVTDLGYAGARFYNNTQHTFIDHRGSGFIYFRADNVNGSSARMAINALNGNVGIGANPEDPYKLVVQGHTRVAGILTGNGGLVSGGTVQSATDMIVGNNIQVAGHIVQEAMNAPTLANFWTQVAGYSAPGFYKGKDQRVYLKGTVQNGLGNVMFNLPDGYRPSELLLFLVPSTDSDGQSVIRVYPNGDVYSQSTGIVRIHLDVISFRVN